MDFSTLSLSHIKMIFFWYGCTLIQNRSSLTLPKLFRVCDNFLVDCKRSENPWKGVTKDQKANTEYKCNDGRVIFMAIPFFFFISCINCSLPLLTHFPYQEFVQLRSISFLFGHLVKKMRWHVVGGVIRRCNSIFCENYLLYITLYITCS